MTKSPKVSIGVPVYLANQYIERCALSLFNQTYQNIEFVFVNDASPDESIEIINRIAEGFPDRDILILEHKINKGSSESRNLALDRMTGEYVLWVDSDDWIDDNVVEILVDKALSTGADMVLYDAMEHHKDSIIDKHQPQSIPSIKEYTIQLLKKQVPHEVWGRLIRREIYESDHIRCLPGVNIGEDFQLTTRLSVLCNKIVYAGGVKYHYNCTNVNSLTRNGSIEQSWSTIDFVKAYFEDKEDYVEAINFMVLWSISCDFVSYARCGEEMLLTEGRRRLLQVDRKFWSQLGISRMLLLYLSRYPKCMTILVRMVPILRQ